MKKVFLKIFMGSALFFTILVSGLVLFSPLLSRMFLHAYIRNEARELLQCPVDIDSAELNLLKGGLVVRGLRALHPERKNETIMSARRVEVKINPFGILFGRISGLEIQIDHPHLTYATDRSGQWELSKRVPLFRRGTGEKRLPVNIDQILMEDGEVEYRDGRAGKTTRIEDIDLKVTQVRLPTPNNPLPSIFHMTLDIDGGGDFEMNGRADFLSPKISFESEAKLSGLPLPPYAPYYDHGLPVRITHGGLAISTKARCDQDYLKAPSHAVISGLKVEPKATKIFGFSADRVVDSMKDHDGNLNLDLMIQGNIRNPQFHVMNNLSAQLAEAMAKSLATLIPDLMKAAPGAIEDTLQKGVGSGVDKIRGLFGH